MFLLKTSPAVDDHLADLSRATTTAAGKGIHATLVEISQKSSSRSLTTLAFEKALTALRKELFAVFRDAGAKWSVDVKRKAVGLCRCDIASI